MSGAWVSARIARSIVSQAWQGEGEPTDAICFRAKHGEIQAKARRWITIENGQKYERQHEPVPRGFWDDGDMQQNWSSGDFVSTTYPDDTKFVAQAIDVTFDEAGIRALVPSPDMVTASAVKTRPDEVGGGKLPRLPDAALLRWRDKLSAQERDLPRDDLAKLCAAAHPNYSIARDRVRGIMPRLNPGPRPIKPDSSA